MDLRVVFFLLHVEVYDVYWVVLFLVNANLGPA